MAHPYSQHKEKHPGKSRVHKMHGHFKHGGAAEHESKATEKKEKRHEKLASGGAAKPELKAHGGVAKPRLDKFARGGKTKHGGGKGHHTKINIMVAPKSGGDAGAGGLPPGGPPPGIGGPPGGPPPMPPGGPLGGPPGGPPPGAGPPGAGGLPPGLPPPGGGGMKRGGAAKHISGISSKENISKWSKHASSNSRYAKGGKVHMTAGALTGEGRLEKRTAYGKRARGN